MIVWIYDDEGSSETCVQELESSFAAIFPKTSVSRIKADKLISSPSLQSATLLVLPGGRSNPYHERLGHQGMNLIRDYVRSGGRYLGICAGAYFACQTTEFEVGTELEIVRHDGLGIFPGKAVGSAYNDHKFEYGTEQDSRIAQVMFGSSGLGVYFNGGCYFEPRTQDNQFAPIGSYQNIEGNPICAVLCEYGSGKALLSGVHVEYSYRGLDLNDNRNQEFYNEMRSNESARVNNFQYLVEMLLQ